MLATVGDERRGMDSTFNIFFKLKYQKTYDAVLATPMRRATSRAARSRGRCSAAASTRRRSSCVMVAMGLVGSWWALLALPARC